MRASRVVDGAARRGSRAPRRGAKEKTQAATSNMPLTPRTSGDERRPALRESPSNNMDRIPASFPAATFVLESSTKHTTCLCKSTPRSFTTYSKASASGFHSFPISHETKRQSRNFDNSSFASISLYNEP